MKGTARWYLGLMQASRGPWLPRQTDASPHLIAEKHRCSASCQTSCSGCLYSTKGTRSHVKMDALSQQETMQGLQARDTHAVARNSVSCRPCRMMSASVIGRRTRPGPQHWLQHLRAAGCLRYKAHHLPARSQEGLHWRHNALAIRIFQESPWCQENRYTGAHKASQSRERRGNCCYEALWYTSCALSRRRAHQRWPVRRIARPGQTRCSRTSLRSGFDCTVLLPAVLRCARC